MFMFWSDLTSYDDLAEQGYGERDEQRRKLAEEEGWRDEERDLDYTEDDDEG